MSVLVPRGWRTDGAVSWKGIGGCRAEIVTWQMSAISPDGAIRLPALPLQASRALDYSWPLLRERMGISGTGDNGRGG